LLTLNLLKLLLIPTRRLSHFNRTRWFFKQKQVDEVAVYIPMAKINNEGANFISILKAIKPEELRRKQEAIKKIGNSIESHPKTYI
jgi:hypothetical protein